MAPTESQNWTWHLVTTKFVSQQPTGKRQPLPLHLAYTSGESCSLAWQMHPTSSWGMMSGILEPMKREIIIVCLDDITIHSGTLVEHVVHVRDVLALQTEPFLKAKHPQWAWACQKVDFCGFGVDKDGIHAQEYKTHAVMDWPKPENRKDVRGFRGLISSYRIFTEHYTHIAMLQFAIGTPPKERRYIGR
jgi:hypothetical protein